MIAARPATDLPLWRLYVLRAMYAVIGLLQGSQTWTHIFHRVTPWDFWHGVGESFLGALTALCLLGIRYPVRMLPLMIFELAWKSVWTFGVWLPLKLANHVDPDTADNFVSIAAGVVVVPLLLPWGYIWKNFVTAPGDRWK